MSSILKTKSSWVGASAVLALVLGGCATSEETVEAEAAAVEETAEMAEEEMVEDVVADIEEAMDEATEMTTEAKLAAILAAQPEDVQARYGARNPAETLAFFGIEPGMTVAEALPGGGWYSKILMPYLGEEGTLIGAHYPDELWSLFNFGEEWAATRAQATANWLTTASEWGVEGGAGLASTYLTAMPEGASDSVDAVLFIRALHNLNRFTDEESNFMGDTLSETYRVLKPGGIVGVVQHSAPETNSDDWANGSNGYLKESDVITAFETAGFELVESSDLNANPKDVPTEEEFVWRLPPSFNGTEAGTPEREAVAAIGESNRMTLKFRKPA
ncbi:MAG: methyltransferase [Pseudomonadota bacterium]